MKTQDIEPFFATLKAANPQPETELEYTNVFELLAAVLLFFVPKLAFADVEADLLPEAEDLAAR